MTENPAVKVVPFNPEVDVFQLNQMEARVWNFSIINLTTETNFDSQFDGNTNIMNSLYETALEKFVELIKLNPRN